MCCARTRTPVQEQNEHRTPSLSEAAANWDLPLPAVEEAFAYCEANQVLIQAEADEERQRLLMQGVDLATA
ncbi:hypothetical protein FACS189497_04390 [Betaproteobacteria bacterium]|nr:hypothetical protein FACS189497_04390 [Betaproteobacteria bacterium]